MAECPVLNHAEMVFRPGDREAARTLFETMGFRVTEAPGYPWLIVDVDADAPPGTRVDNRMYANESTPAQQNLELALDEALAASPDLADKLERFRRIRRAHPQYVFHFGASVATHEDWKERVARLIEANETHSLLKGRVDLDVREPGDPTAIGGLSQAFIYSDIVEASLHQLGGLLFDLQWSPGAERLLETRPTRFPDRLAMI